MFSGPLRHLDSGVHANVYKHTHIHKIKNKITLKQRTNILQFLVIVKSHLELKSMRISNGILILGSLETEGHESCPCMIWFSNTKLLAWVSHLWNWFQRNQYSFCHPFGTAVSDTSSVPCDGHNGEPKHRLHQNAPWCWHKHGTESRFPSECGNRGRSWKVHLSPHKRSGKERFCPTLPDEHRQKSQGPPYEVTRLSLSPILTLQGGEQQPET